MNRQFERAIENAQTEPLDAVSQYIIDAAQRRGIDPYVALRVARSEGLNEYVGDSGSSFGPFQLHYGGVAAGGNRVAGLGDDFTAKTGLNARDPNTVRTQIDFALDHAAKHGWGAFHGAGKMGIDNFAGINGGGASSPRYTALTALAGRSDPTAQRPYIPPMGTSAGGALASGLAQTGGAPADSGMQNYQAWLNATQKPRGPGLLSQLLFGKGGASGMISQNMPNGLIGALTGLKSVPPEQQGVAPNGSMQPPPRRTGGSSPQQTPGANIAGVVPQPAPQGQPGPGPTPQQPGGGTALSIPSPMVDQMAQTPTPGAPGQPPASPQPPMSLNLAAASGCPTASANFSQCSASADR